MSLNILLTQRNISKYQLSQISGIPKTTILDICSGKSSIERCSAKTVQLLAKALGCSMEEIMELAATYDENGLPKTQDYLEINLPDFLQVSIQAMNKAWNEIDNGRKYLHWDCDYCNLQSDINNAEVSQLISTEQAWFLREKYLRMERS